MFLADFLHSDQIYNNYEELVHRVFVLPMSKWNYFSRVHSFHVSPIHELYQTEVWGSREDKEQVPPGTVIAQCRKMIKQAISNNKGQALKYRSLDKALFEDWNNFHKLEDPINQGNVPQQRQQHVPKPKGPKKRGRAFVEQLPPKKRRKTGNAKSTRQKQPDRVLPKNTDLIKVNP